MQSSRSPLRSLRARFKRPALVAVLAMALAGVVAPMATAPALAAGTCTAGDLWNPMGAATPVGSADGYTVFVTGDALLANQELEGSIAVAGTLTFGSTTGFGGGQYPIVHQVAGNGTYDLPTVDGAPNRVLVQQYAPGTRDVTVQVKPQGSTTAAQIGGAKLFDQTAPAGYVLREGFEAGGTTYWPTGGNNMSPQFSSWVQQWDEGAGAGTFAPAQPQFSDYFEADAGTDLLAQTGIWHAPLNFPAGGDVTVTLDPAGPNQVALSDFAGVMKFSLVNHSATSPLIVKVSPSDVVAGELMLPSISQAGQSGDMASYLLFDLSEITGTVTLKTPNEPIRGSIYAPQAHALIPNDAGGGKELEGQVIAQQFTDLASKEIHTNLFKGALPCVATAASEGGFSLAKALSGLVAGALPQGADTEFVVEYFLDGAPTAAGSVTIKADGVAVNGPQDLPLGTVVTFGESTASSPGGSVWTGVVFSPSSVTITADAQTTAVTVTNTYRALVGGFQIHKELTGDGQSLVPAGASFEVKYYLDGSTAPAGTLTLDADGTVASVDGLAEGTVVTFAETVRPTVPGGTWGAATFSPGSVTVADGTVVAVTLTNVITEDEGGDEPGGGDEDVDGNEDDDSGDDDADDDGTDDDGTDDDAEDDDELGVTGTNVLQLLGLATALTMLGGVLVLVGRRRDGQME